MLCTASSFLVQDKFKITLNSSKIPKMTVCACVGGSRSHLSPLCSPAVGILAQLAYFCSVLLVVLREQKLSRTDGKRGRKEAAEDTVGMEPRSSDSTHSTTDRSIDLLLPCRNLETEDCDLGLHEVLLPRLPPPVLAFS